MYKLYYHPGNASFAPHLVLDELNEKYELVYVDRKSEAQKSSSYLELNPAGRIPTLLDGQTVIFESAAICLHVCEKSPGSTLVPAVGGPDRSVFFQWLFYLTTTLQAELMIYFYPGKHTSLVATAAAIAEAQELRVTDMFRLLDRELEGRTYLVGDRLTVCDCYLFMLAVWADELATPPLSFANLSAYLKNLARRPSVQRVCEKEGWTLESYA